VWSVFILASLAGIWGPECVHLGVRPASLRVARPEAGWRTSPIEAGEKILWIFARQCHKWIIFIWLTCGVAERDRGNLRSNFIVTKFLHHYRFILRSTNNTVGGTSSNSGVTLYLPPKGRPRYFDEIGRKKFNEVFPGQKNISDEDIIFYKTLAPYSPALI